MTTRIQIFSNTGSRIGEIDANVTRSWKLNDYGSGSFAMSLEDAKAVVDYLQFGNFVYMTNDKLPDWGGMIDTPRTWGNGIITSSIYQAEYALRSENTGHRIDKFSGSPGGIFTELTNKKIGTTIPVLPGDIFGSGVEQTKVYNYASVYQACKDLADESGHDWDLSPAIDANGSLYFIANWYEHKGVDRQYHLYEDLNIRLSDRVLIEQGTISNRVIGFGNGSAWTSKPAAQINDEESSSKYGYRTFAVSLSVDSLTQVSEGVRNYLAENKEPRRTFDLIALDVGDTYNNIRIGDTLPIDFYTVGFTGGEVGLNTRVRVLQMTFDDIQNQLRLVVDEVV